MKCPFCLIVDKKIPAEIIFESDKVVAFKDIKPKAPIHFLIIPKKHINNLNKLEEKEILVEIFSTIKKIARKLGILQGHQIKVSVGKRGGQEVNHLHFHLLGGWKK